MTSPTVTPEPNGFERLNLAEPLQRALRLKNYHTPSPIQERAIPHLLQGRDLIGIAQTGTGKTAAFALPILHRLAAQPKAATPKSPRALILAPTRELAVQIAQSFAAYGSNLKLTHTAVFGGVSIVPQIRLLARGVDILIATPGRLLDLINQKHLNLQHVEIFVLDEADRMLDLGFAPDVKRIIARLPSHRQSLLFSATMPRPIEEMAAALVRNPERIEVTPVATTAERIDQKVCFVRKDKKRDLLVHLLKENPEGLVLIFVQMKHMANRLVELLAKANIRAEAIHGNKSQAARQRALENFRRGLSRILVATDIAARGIDVKGIGLVINYDLPMEPESYVHRIGRTARAGHEGHALSLCDDSERNLLRSIERTIRRSIPVKNDHPFATAQDERADYSDRTAPGQSFRQHHPRAPHFRDHAPRDHRQAPPLPGSHTPHGTEQPPRSQGGFLRQRRSSPAPGFNRAGIARRDRSRM